MKIQSCRLPSSFLAHSHSLLLYDSMRPHQGQFDSNNQLQDLSTNTNIICGCPGFQRVRQPSAPLAHFLCCFSLFLFSIISLTLIRMKQKRTSVQTELISLDAAKLSSAAVKEKEQLVHYLGDKCITHPCFLPSAEKERTKNLQLLFVHFLKCQKQLGPDTSPSSGSNMQTRGHFFCHRKYEQSLLFSDSLLFSNLLSGRIK